MLSLKNKEDMYLLSTVRIEVELKEGESTGTGFVCSLTDLKYGDLSKVYYLVTNKHVIKDGNKMTLKMHTLDSKFKQKKERNGSVEINLDKQQ